MSLFIGIEQTKLCRADKRRLQSPLCSGVVLFSRNCQNPEQLRALIQEIRQLRPQILIGVDHEGGRVQRFREGFTLLPAAARIGRIFDQDPVISWSVAQACGVILAYELRAQSIDFSFAPVLDLYDPKSTVIGDRAFHENPAIVSVLSCSMRRGMKTVGMAAVGKHFPGHGRVSGDSHHELPIDTRSDAERRADLAPFIFNVQQDIEALMMAHILMPDDTLPASFSAKIIQELRDWGFKGAVVSDDLDMAAAKQFATPTQCVQAVLDAGADAAMICNHFADMDRVIDEGVTVRDSAASQKRLALLRGAEYDDFVAEQAYQKAQATLTKYRSWFVA